MLMSAICDEVDALAGIGKVYKQKLNSIGIFTVQELANTPVEKLKNGSINIEKYQSMVYNAQNYLKIHSTPSNKEEKELDYEQYYTIKHTWYEECARIVDIDCQETKDIVISELHFDPNQRITFLCSWIENGTVLCERSYSPHYLRILSPNLPLLELEFSTLDMEVINMQSLIKTVEEVNTIHNVQHQSYRL